MSSPDEILAAHYAANPHVAAQLQTGASHNAEPSPQSSAEKPVAPASMPLIAEVRAFTVKVKDNAVGVDEEAPDPGSWIAPRPVDYENGGGGPGPPWPPIANPMSVYDQWHGPRHDWSAPLGHLVVEVIAEDGTSGVGVSNAGEPGCWIVENHLSRFVEGQDPRNIELMWDQMWRATMPYGRKGLPIHALSAVDLALWDLLGGY